MVLASPSEEKPNSVDWRLINVPQAKWKFHRQSVVSSASKEVFFYNFDTYSRQLDRDRASGLDDADIGSMKEEVSFKANRSASYLAREKRMVE